MTISAKIITDSIGPNKARITTFVLKYPRFIHQELLTHRQFSRNASSSRAIPFNKQIKMIKEDMAMPVRWGLNQRGMQAYTDSSNFKAKLGKLVWKIAGYSSIAFASILNKLGFHKQIVNRIIEPFSHISVVVTSTDFNNFFALRYHHAAQPEIFELAKEMFKAYWNSTPRKLEEGEWHLPFISFTDQWVADQEGRHTTEDLIKRSVARCARVSYNNHDGTNSTLEQDIKLYDRLVGGDIKHSSPAEHQAQASNNPNLISGNFRGFKQYRKTLINENIIEFYPNKLK